MQDQKSLTLRWRWFLEGIRDILPSIFVYKGSQYYDYGITLLHSHLIIQDATPNNIDARLLLIFTMRTWYRL